MGNRNSNPFKKLVDRIIPKPDPCRNYKSRITNNDKIISSNSAIISNNDNIINDLEHTKVPDAERENTTVKNINTSLYNKLYDPLKDTKSNPTSKPILYDPKTDPLEEDKLRIKIVHNKKKESFISMTPFRLQPVTEGLCDSEITTLNTQRTIIDASNGIIRTNLKRISELNQKIKDYNDETNKFTKDNADYNSIINNKLLYDINNIPMEYPKNKTYKLDKVNYKVVESFDGPTIEGLEEIIEYSSDSGISSTRDAYQTLYKNYYNAYSQSVDLVQNYLQPEIDLLKLSELTGMQYAYTSVKNENELINQQIQENKNKYSTDVKQFRYQNDNLIYLKSINFYIFIIYYIFLLILIYFMIFIKTSHIMKKLIIVFVMLIFPFILKPIQEYIHFILHFTVTHITGNVFSINEYIVWYVMWYSVYGFWYSLYIL